MTESHGNHGKVVHRLCSSCISSVENLIETLLSFFCQTLIKEQLALFQYWSWLTDIYLGLCHKKVTTK